MAGLIKGSALFLAQFAGDDAPYNTLENITKWASDLGYKGVQIPILEPRLFDLKKAAESQTYCDEVKGICADAGLEITELSTHLQDRRYCQVNLFWTNVPRSANRSSTSAVLKAKRW